MLFVLGVIAMFIGVLILNVLGTPWYSRRLNLWDHVGVALVLGGIPIALYGIVVLGIKYLS